MTRKKPPAAAHVFPPDFLTVGSLREALAAFPPETPVRIDQPSQMDGGSYMTAPTVVFRQVERRDAFLGDDIPAGADIVVLY